MEMNLEDLPMGLTTKYRKTITIKFTKKEEVPAGLTVTYANFMVDCRPLKSEPFRTRLTVRGNRLEYHDDALSPAASLLDSELLFNTTISDARIVGRFISCDLKYFFLETHMSIAE